MIGLKALLHLVKYLINISIVNEGNTESIARLEYNQGHQLRKILNYYNIYNNKDCLIYNTDDEEDNDEPE